MNYEDCANWTKWLSKFIDTRCKGLEIGSYEGESAVWFAKNILTHPESRIMCIDQWVPIEPYTTRGTDFDGVYKKFIKAIKPYPQIDFVCNSSHSSLRRMIGSYDFAYIDGSHWPIDVLQDAVLTFDLVNPGGVIIFDDYEWTYQGSLSTPKIAIDAFLSVYEGKYELLHKGYQVAIVKG